ncbi:hypothetical protein ACWC9T_17800 [Kitasatospora sp. NPDC001159]
MASASPGGKLSPTPDRSCVLDRQATEFVGPIRERQSVPGRDHPGGHLGDLQAGYPGRLAGEVAGDLRAASEVAVEAGELVVDSLSWAARGLLGYLLSLVEVPSVPPSEKLKAGVSLLLELGRREPRMALAGKPLTDQVARVEGLLAGGWSKEALVGILSAPLPEEVTHSVGAIVAARIAKVPLVPAARAAADGPRRHECPGRDGMCGRLVAGAGQACDACRAVTRRRSQAGR